jgi:D-3-phosphoglycerate dehydrogenase
MNSDINSRKVLFIDTAHNILFDKLTSAGFVCDDHSKSSKETIEEIIHNYEGIVLRSRITLDKELINLAKNLKFIGRVGAGLESIDVDYAESKGIKCFNSPEGNRDAVGEHAMGMLLSLFNNICAANTEVSSGEWNREKNRGLEIKGKTVGIIGYGNMGSTFAKKLSGFEANVISYDKYKNNYQDNNTTESTLEDLFENADILSLHVPLTEETRYMVDEAFINKFKKPIYIINTARGPVVKTDDLVEALKSEKVLGAAIDVLEYEETSFEIVNNTTPAFNFLKESKNVLISPHIAGWTVQSKVRLAEVIADKIINEFY